MPPTFFVAFAKSWTMEGSIRKVISPLRAVTVTSKGLEMCTF